MTLAAFLLWFTEFALEIRGAVATRQYRLLSAYLWFWAASDIATFVTYHLYGWQAYSWAYWIQEAGEYFILLLLCCQISGKLVNETSARVVQATSCLIAGVATKAVWIVYGQSESIADKLLDSEIAACMLLGILILLAWMGQQRRLERPWNLIAAAVVFLLASNGLISALWKVWEPARHFMVVPEIAALVAFNLAGRGKLSEFRDCLGYRAEPTEIIRTRVV